MSTGGTDREPSGVKWTEVSLSQISIVVGEIEDRIAINLGDGGIGKFKGVIANLYTFPLSPLDFDRLFFVDDYSRNR